MQRIEGDMKDLIFSGEKVVDGRIIYGDACMCENGKVYIFVRYADNFVKISVMPDSLRVKTIERS